MTSEFKRFFWQQRELEHILRTMRPALDTWSTIPQSFLGSIGKLEMLRNQFTLPNDYLEMRSEILEVLAVKSSVESLCHLRGLGSASVESLQLRELQIEELTRNLNASSFDVGAALRSMVESLVSTEALIGLGRLDKISVELALQPQLAFQNFATAHLRLAAADLDVARQNRLALLDSGARLLDSITKGFDLAALLRPPSESLWIGPIREVNIYHALDDELETLDLGNPEIDTVSAVEESRSGMVAELGAQLVQLVYNLNVESEREGRSPVFKPTTATLMACAIIPSRVACDANSFAEIVDQLFFLLYEGSGSAKRIAVGHDQSKLDALWRLKHLRLGTRHDLDHGSEIDVEKKNRKVGEAYVKFLGRVAPRRKADWMTVQIALYRELVEMLESVWLGEAD